MTTGKLSELPEAFIRVVCSLLGNDRGVRLREYRTSTPSDRFDRAFPARVHHVEIVEDNAGLTGFRRIHNAIMNLSAIAGVESDSLQLSMIENLSDEERFVFAEEKMLLWSRVADDAKKKMTKTKP